MKTPPGTPWVIRSLLFVPGHMEDLFPKAARSGADCVVLDLQDAVPPAEKRQARQTVRQALASGPFQQRPVMVRVNAPETGLLEEDVASVAGPELDGFVHPMSGTPAEIQALDDLLKAREQALGLSPGHFAIIVLIETPLGVLNAHAMASASERVVALLFGAEDFLTELQGREDAQQRVLHTPRAQIALAARAAGLEALDTPYVQVHDVEGLAAHAHRARDLGMSGMLVISPRQIPAAHAVYTPSEAELEEAREVLALAEETRQAGRSYALSGDQLIAPSREKQAQRLLARAEVIQKREADEEEQDGRE
jgi:citrate lyase subunit beta/citryl-CoA lyase